LITAFFLGGGEGDTTESLPTENTAALSRYNNFTFEVQNV